MQPPRRQGQRAGGTRRSRVFAPNRVLEKDFGWAWPRRRWLSDRACSGPHDRRGTTPGGRKIYTLQDIYHHADFITYPSTREGFGNAFLEAVYFRKPILVNHYSIYTFDIKPKGFSAVEIDGYVTDEAVENVRALMEDTRLREDMVETNYALGKMFYSHEVLHKKLMNLMV